ncbi:MAG: tsaB [Fibrobacteres bacterium]|nr:tsaB [Fibrobacterota bacterium]
MKSLSLVLDLSASLSLGLVDADNGVLSYRIREQGTRGETAHALLEECLAEAGRGIADIADICVGVGPGSFTGIRVCAAMAQGLAFADRLPLYPFSSLAGILTGAHPGSAGTLDGPDERISAIAANAGRYFIRRSGPAGEALVSADDLLALGSPRTVLVTSGHFPDKERMRPAFASLERHEDNADFPAMVRLAHGSPPVTDGVLRPNYLMASAAEEKRRSGEAPR